MHRTCLFHKKGNRLKARVVIYAYQHHVRLLSPSLWSSSNQSYSGRGADIVMQSSKIQAAQSNSVVPRRMRWLWRITFLINPVLNGCYHALAGRPGQARLMSGFLER